MADLRARARRSRRRAADKVAVRLLAEADTARMAATGSPLTVDDLDALALRGDGGEPWWEAIAEGAGVPGEAVPAVRARLRQMVLTRAASGPVPAGRYVVTVDGATAAYRVDAGALTAKRLDGNGIGGTAVSAAKLRAVLDAIGRAGTEVAAAAYQAAHGRCSDCGRPLSDPTSVARMRGPRCEHRRASHAA